MLGWCWCLGIFAQGWEWIGLWLPWVVTYFSFLFVYPVNTEKLLTWSLSKESKQTIFIPRHFKKVRGIMLYPPQKICVRVSVRPSVRPSVCPSVRPSVSASFPGSILSIYGPIFFKLCIGVHIRKEWFGIEDG